MPAVNANMMKSSDGLIQTVGDLSVWKLCGILILFTVAFFNLISLDAAKETVELDVQVYLKLLVVGCAGLYGLLGYLTDSRVRQAALSFPAAWVLVIFILYFLSSFVAIDTPNALASSISILCVYLMTITGIVSLGKLNTLKTVFYGSGLFVIGSWIVYFLVPDIGIMNEPLAEGEFVTRMSGLAHPNTLGQFCSISIILGVALNFSYGQKSKFLTFLVLLAVLALFNSLSRTSIVATAAGLLVGYRHLVFGQHFVRRTLVGSAIVLVVLLAASTQIDFQSEVNKRIKMFTKSGDAEEITSATGRGVIWAKTIELIKHKPALGYGPTSSKYLLEDYSMYTHNLLLNITLSCGIGGAIAGMAMCFGRLKMMISNHSVVADALVVFVFVNGLFENVIFSNLCGLPTVCWVIGLVWFHVEQDEQRGAE